MKKYYIGFNYKENNTAGAKAKEDANLIFDKYGFKKIKIEGILAIQAGDNPKFLKEKLVTYLAQGTRAKILDQEGEGGGGKKGKKGKKGDDE